MLIQEIRELWIRFFQQHHHVLVPPVSVVPVNDPSLLFINSGIATLKPYFQGFKKPPACRLVNTQLVIRTNDIDNIGVSTRHLSLFEMLGNFSIGAYFKKKAIMLAWEFLTSTAWLGLAREKLYITVHPQDQETYFLWTSCTNVLTSNVLFTQQDVNFWKIGVGPCGPCTEIFYDLGSIFDPYQKGTSLLIEDIDNDRFLEIWNIVFSQYQLTNNGSLVSLKQKNIDTGAGLERLACVLQKKHNPYQITFFQNIIALLEKILISGRITFRVAPIPYRVIADHARTIVIMVYYGVLPSNKKQGYVLRRLIRRALLFSTQLKQAKPFLFRLVPDILVAMGTYYFLKEQNVIKNLQSIILTEEHIFFQLLKTGQKLLSQLIIKKAITNNTLFLLHTSHGLPLEWLSWELKKKNIQVKWSQVKKLVLEHQLLSKNNYQKTNPFNQLVEVWNQYEWKTTNLSLTTYHIHSHVLLLFTSNQSVHQLHNQRGYIVLQATSFFVEKGGQVTDVGTIFGEKFTAQVLHVQALPGKRYIHLVQINGIVNVGDLVCVDVPQEQRRSSERHHSATHLLHAGCQQLLGTKATQVGSWNSWEGLRLDINYTNLPSDDIIVQLEKFVQNAIKNNITTQIYHTNYHQAVIQNKAWSQQKFSHNNLVRVVRFSNVSHELCGGTHVTSTAQLQDFLIYKTIRKGYHVVRFYALAGQKIIQQFLSKIKRQWKQKITNKIQNINIKFDQSPWKSFLQTQLTSHNYHQQLKKYHYLMQKIDTIAHRHHQHLIQQQLIYQLPTPVLITPSLASYFWVSNNKINLKEQAQIFIKQAPRGLFYLLASNTTGQYYFCFLCEDQTIDVRRIILAGQQQLRWNIKGGGNARFCSGRIIWDRPVSDLQKKLFYLTKKIFF